MHRVAFLYINDPQFGTDVAKSLRDFEANEDWNLWRILYKYGFAGSNEPRQSSNYITCTFTVQLCLKKNPEIRLPHNENQYEEASGIAQHVANLVQQINLGLKLYI